MVVYINFFAYLCEKFTIMIKLFLRTPLYLVDFALSKLNGTIPTLLRFDIIEAVVDTDSSMDYNRFVSEKYDTVSMDDLSNPKIKRIFKNFGRLYIYRSKETNYESRHSVYISRKPLTDGCLYTGRRISDYKLNKNYKSNKIRKYLMSKLVTDISAIEPEFYVFASPKTSKHKEQEARRKVRYAKKRDKNFIKLVNKCIKDDRLFYGFNAFGDSLPIAFKIVKKDDIKIAKKFFDSLDIVDLKRVLSTYVSDTGETSGIQTNYHDKCLHDYIKSEEMKKIIKENENKL